MGHLGGRPCRSRSDGAVVNRPSLVDPAAGSLYRSPIRALGLPPPARRTRPGAPATIRGRVGRGADHPGLADGGPGTVAVRRRPRLPAGATVLEIGSHQGRSTVVLAAAAAGARGSRGRASTRSSTAGSSAARPPATSSRATCGDAGLDRLVELLAEYSTQAAARPGRGTSTCSTSTASTTTGRSPTTCAGRRHLPAGGAGAGPRLLLLDRRHPRASWPRSCRPRRCATSVGQRSLALFRVGRPGVADRGADPARDAVVDPQRRRQGAAAAAPAPRGRGVRARLAVRPLLTGRVRRSAPPRPGRPRVPRRAAGASTTGWPAARPTRTSRRRAGR